MNLPRMEKIKHELREIGVVHLLVIVLVLAAILLSSQKSLFSGKGISLPMEGPPSNYRSR